MNRRMKEKVKISVVVPVYNVKEYLEKAVHSILNQTYRNLEVLLVDDGSDDGSHLICESLEKVEERVRYFRKEHEGPVNARKFGIENADGIYIGFVDSDDWIAADMYEKMYDCIEDQTDIVCCGFFVDQANKESYKRKNNIKPGKYSTQELIQEVFPKMIFDMKENKPGILQSACTKLFKTEKLLDCIKNQNRDITYGDDASMVYSYLLQSNNIILLDDAYYHYTIRNNSLCRSYDLNIFQHISAFYTYMTNLIESYPIAWNLHEQLKCYMLHFIHMGIYNLYGIEYSPCYIVPYELIIGCKRIVLYGAGKVGKMYYSQLVHQDGLQIVKWIDVNKAGQVYFQRNIETPDKLKDEEVDGVLLAVKDEEIAKEIHRQLKDNGIQESKIFWRKPIENSFINFADLYF